MVHAAKKACKMNNFAALYTFGTQITRPFNGNF